jgi:PAS domain S-box-containing protein
MGFNQLAESDELILGEALERQQILETVINNSPVMAFLWTPDENWPAKYVSENVSQLEYSAEEFLTGRIMYADIVHSEDIDRVRKELTRCCETGKDSFVQRYRVLTGKGEVRWVEEKTFIQRDEGGNVANFQGIVRDVTQEIKNERALRDALESQKALMEKQKALLERQKALETVINNSPMVVFLWKAEKYWPTLYVSENVRQFGSLLRTSFPEESFMEKLSIPKTCSLWNLNLRKTVKKEERSSTANTESLLIPLKSAGLMKKPLFSAMRKEKLLISRAL